MEKEETFVLMSMKEPKSKDLANALSNETSRKIVSYLAEKKEATETQLAKDLKLPLTTIHYNIKLLQKSKLIDSKEFYWSRKGKEMLVYKLAKKFIIIAPSDSESTLSKLKNLLPVTLLAFIGSGIIYLFQRGNTFGKTIAEEGAEVAQGITGPITEGTNQITTAAPNYALWFLLGSLFVVLLVFLFSLRKKR